MYNVRHLSGNPCGGVDDSSCLHRPLASNSFSMVIWKAWPDLHVAAAAAYSPTLLTQPNGTAAISGDAFSVSQIFKLLSCCPCQNKQNWHLSIFQDFGFNCESGSLEKSNPCTYVCFQWVSIQSSDCPRNLPLNRTKSVQKLS